MTFFDRRPMRATVGYPDDERLSRRSAPAWALSWMLHAALLLVLAWVWRAGPKGRLPAEPERRADIVIVEPGSEVEPRYLNELPQDNREADQTSESELANSKPEPTALAALPGSDPPVDLDVSKDQQWDAGAIPDASLAGPLSLPSLETKRRVRLPSGTDIEAVLRQDAAEQAARRRAGTPVSVALFGSPDAVGRSFVFLIDRSHSMGGDGLGAIGAAESQLVAALQRLSPEHQFQIIAYNERPAPFGSRELRHATEENKTRAHEFLKSIVASGKTDHDLALHTALRLKPDVIFLLTDGGDPALTRGQQQVLVQIASRVTTIHAIQFGFGALQDDAPFLRRLTESTGGDFTYIDMNRQPSSTP